MVLFCEGGNHPSAILESHRGSRVFGDAWFGVRAEESEDSPAALICQDFRKEDVTCEYAQ